MCLQCNTAPVYFGEPLPRWTLARARVHHPDWPIGWWGLILETNDPIFVWELTPTPSALWGMTEVQEEQWWERKKVGEIAQREADREVWFDGAAGQRFLDAFACKNPMIGYELVTAAMSAGYERDRHGARVEMWLFDYLGEYLRTAPVEVDEVEDARLRRRGVIIDTTIGREPRRPRE